MRARARLVIDPALVASNISKIDSLVSGRDKILMVKANAYGHGLIDFSRLLLKLHESKLGVASLFEALELRRELKQTPDIFVFSDTHLEIEKNLSFYSDLSLTPVISNLEELKVFFSSNITKHIPVVLKFNTGMNRLGFDLSELEAVIKLIKQSGRKSIDHVMSHFACGGQSPELSHNKRQIENFEIVLKELRASGLTIEATSMANSGAIEQGMALQYSHVRPGLMLYGPSSLSPGLESRYDGAIVSSLKASVLEVRTVSRGTPVGYGATVCHEDGQLVIMGVGYGDGINNRYQKCDWVMNRESGEEFPTRVLGRVNMDMLAVLVSPEVKIKRFEELTLWNNDSKRFHDLCDKSKIIPYEIFCQLSGRVPRVFKLA